MARKKPGNEFKIKSLDEVNAALEEIAKLQRYIKAVEADMNGDIDAIKAGAESVAAQHMEKLTALEAGIQAYAEYNKAELFRNKKSIPLNFGVIGFRMSQKLKPAPKTTWKRILEILKEQGLKSAIRVKEDVNKDVLGEWSDERLESVNVQRVRKDQFWYEVAEEELKEGV